MAFGISVAGLLAAGALTVADLGRAMPAGGRAIMGDLVVVDGLAAYFRLLFIFAGLATVLFAWTSEEIMGRRRENKGEFFALTVLMTVGHDGDGRSPRPADALPFAGGRRPDQLRDGRLHAHQPAQHEASLKYVIFGAVSSAIMLYGLSLLYGMTGSLRFDGIRAVAAGRRGRPVRPAGRGGADPGRHRLQDRRRAVPLLVPGRLRGRAHAGGGAVLAWDPKAAGFALMIRFFYSTLSGGSDPAAGAALIKAINWPLLVAVISAVTMTFGNLVALRQSNVKRMLAYSSIAHVGYLLMGFVLLSDDGLSAILFYLLVYTLMNLGAFFFVVAVNNHLKSEELADYAGLGYRLPWAGVMMVVFLGSLTGVPPFAGFVGKLYLFTAVMDRQWFWLVIIAGLNSVISLYYYFRVAKVMWLSRPAEGADASPLRLSWLQYVVLAFLAIPTLALGLYFGQFKDLADAGIRTMAGG